MPPNETQSSTPPWKDKPLYVAVLAALLPIVNRKFGLGLDAGELLSAIAPLVGFIVGSKWKSGHIIAEEIKAKNLVTLPAGMTNAQAALLLAQLGLPPVATAVVTPNGPPAAP